MLNAEFYLIRNGITWPLSAGAPLELIKIDGIATPPVLALTERGPLQHGDTDLDFRLDPRMLTLILQGTPNYLYSYTALRKLLNKLFTPTNAPCVFRSIFNDGSVYDIAVRSLGVTEMPSEITQQILLKAGIQLRAADPLFYNPSGFSITFGIAGGSGGSFTIPSFVPTFVGSSTLNQSKTFTYNGTFDEYPVITMVGPITNPVLTHNNTGNKLDFTGYTITNGDYYTIDLRFGRKIVYRNGSTSDSQIAKLTTDSDLDTFAVSADPFALNGENTYTMTGTSVTSVTQVYIQGNERYAGI